MSAVVRTEFQTQVSFWGNPWKPSEDYVTDLVTRRGVPGIRLRTVARTVTTTEWEQVGPVHELVNDLLAPQA